MRLIIDIPDEDYKFIKDLKFYNSGRRIGKTIDRNVINAIKNGTPLPKGQGVLKAEKIAMLEELKMEIEEEKQIQNTFIMMI